MANNPNEPSTDDFLDQILSYQNFPNSETTLPLPNAGTSPHMMLQLSSGAGAGFHGAGLFPLGLSLEQAAQPSSHGGGFREDIVGIRPPQVFQGQPMANPVSVAPHPPSMRPRVRARRGQATDPHSIAERLRREKIAERIRALQELVPSVNKTDRAAMLDEIVDYVKFLRLQVKVLSMSRLGGAGAVAPLVTDIPLSAVEEEGGEGRNQPAWEKWTNDGTERQVAKLMEENVGAAMQFLQSKSLCIMPVSLATAIYHAQPSENSTFVKPEINPPP